MKKYTEQQTGGWLGTEVDYLGKETQEGFLQSLSWDLKDKRESALENVGNKCYRQNSKHKGLKMGMSLVY